MRLEEEILSRQAQMEEFMFLGLRKIEGIRIAGFKETFGCEIDSVYGEILQKLQKECLILRDENQIHLTERGIDISNYVLSQFLLDE